MTFTRVLSVVSVALCASFLAFPAMAQNDKAAKGKEVAAEHRSDVSKIIQDLKDIAGRDFDIGPEVSEVAKDQEASNEKAEKAMEAVENRGGFRTFLFGTDYKNIGVLRSTLVTTEHSINRLEKAMERATVASVKVNLQTQIDALKQAKEDVEEFIVDNEGKLSLLGWVTKYFAQ